MRSRAPAFTKIRFVTSSSAAPPHKQSTMQTYRRHVVTHVSLTAIIARAARAISGRDWRVAGSTGYCLMMDLYTANERKAACQQRAMLYILLLLLLLLLLSLLLSPTQPSLLWSIICWFLWPLCYCHNIGG